MEYLPFLFIAIGVAFMLFQWRAVFSARRQRGKAAPPLSDLLEPDMDPAGPLLFYFYSEQCGPCRRMGPVIDRLAAERGGVVKVDVQAHPDAARRFGVMGTPTLVVVVGGRIERVVPGSVSERRLGELLG